jgi:nicotinic acid mononucleotide adenylyltransferase
MSINYTNENTIIFTLARMNPPTPGHLYLISRLIEEAITKNVNEVFIILSKTNDDNENPISCPEKIAVLGDVTDISKTMINTLKQIMIHQTPDPGTKDRIQNIQIFTICVPDQKGATPFTPIVPIIAFKKHIPQVNLVLIIGDDRKSMLDSITDYFFKWDNIYSIDGIVLPREEMSEYKQKSYYPEQLDKLEMSTVPVNAMSASFVRNIVRNNRRDKFMELYSPYLDEQKIPGLYEMILRGISLLPSKSKKDLPEKPLKYRYPMIKGVSEFNIKVPKKGGKKMKTNKRSKRQKKRKTIKATYSEKTF